MRFKLVTFSILCWGFLSVDVAALPQDREQSIAIESNRAHRDEKMGLTIYEGSVVIIQGSIRIEANKVIISNVGDKASKIVCLGNPARYQQKPSEEKQLIIAKANRIEYLLAKETITLLGKASLEQSGGTIIGERIEYNLKNEIVNAKGSAKGNERIQMVIPAQKLDKSKEQSNEEVQQ